MARISFAQTRFTWGDSRFDVSNYKHFETCAAVGGRLLDSLLGHTTVITDTLHHSIWNANNPLSSAIVDATKRCVARFAAETLVTESPYFAQAVYLRAGDDAKAKIILDRKLASIPRDQAEFLMEAIDSGMQKYLDARPSRVPAALALYETIEKNGIHVPIMAQLYCLSRLANGSWKAKDTAAHARIFGKMIALSKAMSQEDWNSQPGQQATAIIWMQLDKLSRVKFEARLAQSTQAFHSLYHELFVEVVGREPQMSLWTMPNDMVGTAAKKIHGDFWFPAQSAGTTYPREGKVTLAVSLRAPADWPNASLIAGAVLRRLKKQTPELDIVLITGTHGHFKVLTPPPPDIEAAMIDSLYRQMYAMPGVLAVTNTSFWRLPGFDRRRVNDERENQLNGYEVENAINVTTLIDKEGKIVSSWIPGVNGGEDFLERLIPVLQARVVGAK